MSGAESCLTLASVACIGGAVAAAMFARMALAAFLSGTIAVIAALLAVLYALHGDGTRAAGNAGIAVFWAWLWWQLRRRKRRRSLRALGEKTRAVFAALARNMPRPGPAVRPAPQGARA